MNSTRTALIHAPHRRGFTLVEILVVVSIIGILIGILLPTLSIVRGNAARAGSMANMKQSFMLIQSYAQANRETIVPSAFDFTDPLVQVKGKVRSEVGPPFGSVNAGTWADILWTDAGYGPAVVDENTDIYHYRFDNPDDSFYDRMPGFDRTPFRSKTSSTIPFEGQISLDPDIVANKLGGNATVAGVPAQFAANQFFDSRYDYKPGNDGFKFRKNTNHAFDATKGPYFTFGELARPEICAYLVDSFAGETIDTVDTDASAVRPFEIQDPALGQVAFRYPGGTCLILLLDGHVRSESKWDSFDELEGEANDLKSDGTQNEPTMGGDQGRGIRFRHLDMR